MNIVSNLIKRKFKYLLSTISRLEENPIIILGNQKSGTTAIAALLSEIAGLSVSLDVEDIYKVKAGELTFEQFVHKNRYFFSRKIIKEPCLTFLYDDLKKKFPLLRPVMIVRDPRDNIRSILNRLDIDGRMEELGNDIMKRIPICWHYVLDGTWLGLKGNTYIEMMAARWNYAADLYINNKDEMIMMRYEDFEKDKIEAIEDLARKLQLNKRNDIAAKVDIQYQPKGNRDIKWDQFYGNDNLRTIEEICGGRMRKLGYLC